MRNLLRCRRGSAAFVTVVALVPLIGVVALGAEAGSWYVTKQHAQNAADTAAMSGALRWHIQKAAVPTISDSQTYDYRGRQFAAQNAFCNAGDPPIPAPNVLRLRQEPRGQYRSIGVTSLPTLGRARRLALPFVPLLASNSQHTWQKCLVCPTVNIPAQAIARVQNPKDLCFLGLGSSPSSKSALTIGGSSTINGNGCGLMSNTRSSIIALRTFNGPGWAVNAVNGCKAGHCDVGVPHNYNMLPATNPLQVLDTASFNTRTGSTTPLSDNRATSATLTLTHAIR